MKGQYSCSRQIVALLVLLLGLSGWTASLGAAPVEQTIKVGMLERRYLISLPSTYRSSGRYPLLLVFHGGGGNPEQVLGSSDLLERADKAGWIVVAPAGSGRFARMLTWNVGFGFGYALRSNIDDVGFARQLIASLKSSYAIDPERIFATGISNGGILCHQLAAQLSGEIAAIAPIVATAGGKASHQAQWTTLPLPKLPVSVISFNGALDRNIPAEGGLQKKAIAHEPVEIWSMAQSTEFWVRQNQCTPGVEESNPVGKYRRMVCRDGKGGSEVVQYLLLDQGHAWPGGKKGHRLGDEPSASFSANVVMFEFFSRHPKTAEP